MDQEKQIFTDDADTLMVVVINEVLFMQVLGGIQGYSPTDNRKSIRKIFQRDFTVPVFPAGTDSCFLHG